MSDANNPPRRSFRFQSEEEASRYVDDQLRDGLPPDWAYHKEKPLLWQIAPRERKANSSDEGYVLEVSGDYHFFILYYGNAPGGCAGIRHSLWTAMVLTNERLSDCSLAEGVTFLITHSDRFSQNIWTLT